MRLRRGTRLGKYRLEKRIGEGGSAEVWQGRDTVQDRRVAVKVFSAEIVAAFGRRDIEREARIAERLEHPNVVGVRNADWAGDRFILVTDLALRSLEGYTMPRRSPQLALSLIHDVAQGLAYAHAQKVIHRDIKPANIMLYPGRIAKLGDFGTARFAPAATRLQTEVGTMGYMAPEQAYGLPRYASDVFSLGLTAYELLTGTLPTWPFEWPLLASDRFYERVPEPVQPVLRRALNMDLKRRWIDGRAFLRAFTRALESTKPESKRRVTRRRKRKTKTPFELETRWFRRQHGAALGARYDCHACSGPIAESMSVCPWCGSDRNSFAALTAFPLICPDCERGIRPEWKACPWCFPARLEGNNRKPPFDPKAERTCQRKGCDGQLRPFMRYCPMCKAKVKRPWRLEGLEPCQRCRWPTAERWRFCAWCGRQQRDALRVR